MATNEKAVAAKERDARATEDMMAALDKLTQVQKAAEADLQAIMAQESKEGLQRQLSKVKQNNKDQDPLQALLSLKKQSEELKAKAAVQSSATLKQKMIDLKRSAIKTQSKLQLYRKKEADCKKKATVYPLVSLVRLLVKFLPNGTLKGEFEWFSAFNANPEIGKINERTKAMQEMVEQQLNQQPPTWAAQFGAMFVKPPVKPPEPYQTETSNRPTDWPSKNQNKRTG